MKTLEYSHFLEHILTTLTSNKYPDAFKIVNLFHLIIYLLTLRR